MPWVAESIRLPAPPVNFPALVRPDEERHILTHAPLTFPLAAALHSAPIQNLILPIEFVDLLIPDETDVVIQRRPASLFRPVKSGASKPDPRPLHMEASAHGCRDESRTRRGMAWQHQEPRATTAGRDFLKRRHQNVWPRPGSETCQLHSTFFPARTGQNNSSRVCDRNSDKVAIAGRN